MGVLLYALLCGFLPFDDENIAALYRKIQAGVYEKPAWLTQGSLQLLSQMLQVDPKKRITVKQLLTHPWILDGYEKPVKWQSKYRTSALDEEIVGVMSQYFGVSRQSEAENLLKWNYEKHTATYLILLNRKQNGKDFHILPQAAPPQIPGYDLKPLPDLIVDRVNTPVKRNILGEVGGHGQGAGPGLGNSPRALHTSMEGGLDNVALLGIGTPPGRKDASRDTDKKDSSHDDKQDNLQPFERSTGNNGNRNRASERYHIPHKKAVKEQQQRQDAEDKENFATPLETPIRRQRSRKGQTAPEATPVLSPSKSMDSGMNELSLTPNKGGASTEWFATPSRPPVNSGSVTPKSSKKVFGSIERGLDKMKNMLTPRKRVSSSDGPQMVSGKALCNVSTTAHHNPDHVLNELTKALMCKGIHCQQKGYILRGKIIDPSGTAKLSFELEVCRIPNLNVVGIRRKRLKGDAWCYKKVCEEVLKMTAVSSKQ